MEERSDEIELAAGWLRHRRKRAPAPTTRQLMVLRMAMTDTHKEVAHALGVTEQTVKNTMGDIYRRLGVRTALQAAAAVGWLDTSTPRVGASALVDEASRLLGEVAAATMRMADIASQLMLDMEAAEARRRQQLEDMAVVLAKTAEKADLIESRRGTHLPPVPFGQKPVARVHRAS